MDIETAKAIIEKLEEVLPHVARQTINRYLKELADAGKIRQVGNLQITKGKNKGYWELCK